MKRFNYKEYFRDVILNFLSHNDIESDIYGDINGIVNWWFNDEEDKVYTKEELIRSIRSDKTKIVELLEFITEIIWRSNYKDKYFVEFDEKESDYQFIINYNNILVGVKINYEDFSYTYHKVKRIPYTCYKYVKA